MKTPSYVKCQYTDLVPVEKIKPDPRNPNRHPKTQIARLAKLLKAQGIRKPLIVDAGDGLLKTGHGTLEAIKLNGWKLVPVSRQRFKTPALAYAHMVADNGIGQASELDLEAVGLQAAELGLEVGLFGLEGFDQDPRSRKEAVGAKELDPSAFSKLTHTCPKCGFTFDNRGKTKK